MASRGKKILNLLQVQPAAPAERNFEWGPQLSTSSQLSPKLGQIQEPTAEVSDELTPETADPQPALALNPTFEHSATNLTLLHVQSTLPAERNSEWGPQLSTSSQLSPKLDQIQEPTAEVSDELTPETADPQPALALNPTFEHSASNLTLLQVQSTLPAEINSEWGPQLSTAPPPKLDQIQEPITEVSDGLTPETADPQPALAQNPMFEHSASKPNMTSRGAVSTPVEVPPEVSSEEPMDMQKRVLTPPIGPRSRSESCSSSSSDSSSSCSSSSCSCSSTSSNSSSDLSSADDSIDDPSFQSKEVTESDDETSTDDSQVVGANLPGPSNQDVPIFTSPLKKGKKRKRNPKAWHRNVLKMMRNSGKSYKFTSRAKGVDDLVKIREERKVKSACDEKCKLQCSHRFSEEERGKIHAAFWDLSDVERQRQYIANSMKTVEPKVRVIRVGGKRPPRKSNNAFHFLKGNQQIRVCKLFFKNTLDITDRPIRTVLEKKDQVAGVLIEKDLRGKHGKQKKLDPEIKKGARQFIESIPKIESHYTRANSTRLYIDGAKSIAELHKDYVAQCKEGGTQFVNYVMFYRIFTEDFNISFFSPKKDLCETCVQFGNADENEKAKLKEGYDQHLAEKQLSREEKKTDKMKPSASVAVYDLQAVMQLPKGEVSLFYYSSKLNVFNFTIYNLKNDYCECFVWDEGNGHRGVNELGTCVLRYLEKLSGEKEVIFFSDDCAGQQKNKFMIALYMYAVKQFDLESITHKFLIKGHTQNEGDSAHSLIERQVKRTLKSGPMYTTESFVSAIKVAKKTAPPFNVNLLCHEDFYDIKSLADHVGPLIMKDVNLSSAKVIRIEKTSPDSILVKHSYSEPEFAKIKIVRGNRRGSNRRQQALEPPEFSLQRAFDSRPGITERKKQDLLNLVNKNLIPAAYKSFFTEL